MSSSTSNALSALRWAAGFGAEPSTAGPIDADELHRQALRHRMVGRLLERLEASTPNWANAEAISLLTATEQQHHDLYQDHHQEMRRLIASQVSADAPVISLKGPNVYALTGNPHHIREFGDLDLLPQDLVGFAAAAERIGYRYGKAPASYEYACLLRDGAKLEIHRWVNFEDPLVVPSEEHYQPGKHPGIWRQQNSAALGTLTYDQCIDYCTPGLLELPGIVVPAPALAALSYIGHAYQDYVNFYQYGGRGRPLIRIGEMREILDLLQAPDFDPDQFTRLASVGRAERTVAWYVWLLAAHLDAEVPGEVRELAARHGWPTTGVPTKVTGGVFCDLEFTDDDLFDRRIPIGTLVQRLGSNEIKLSDMTHVALRLTTSGTASAPTRVIAADLESADGRVATVTVGWFEDCLFFKFHFVADESCDKVRVCIDFGDLYTETILMPAAESGSGSSTGSDLTTEICVPMYALPDQLGLPRPAEISLLIQVHGEHPLSVPAFSLLVPVVIRLS